MSFSMLLMSFVAGGALGFVGCLLFLRREQKELLEQNAKLSAENQSLAGKAELHQKNLESLEKRFSLQFENLANRIFDEKTNKFKKESHEGLSQLLTPLREKLQEFQKKVEDSEKEQFSLKKEIQNIVQMNEKMSLQAESLTKALKGDVKAQGNWGEVMLEKILEDSGLRRGTDYIVQGTDMGLKQDGNNRTLKPDVVVMLPEGKHVIIDSKVSLTHYERYCTAAGDTERSSALKEYIASVKAHVTGLEQKRYQDIEKLGTPDFVLMFMPIEGAYSLAVQQDTGLHGYAWDKKIVIVPPSILFATLRTIASVWKIELQNRHAQEIARQGGGLYDKIVSFVEDMQDLGKRLGMAQDTFNEAFKKLSTGQGNIVKRAQDLQALGVKSSKKMPRELADDGNNVETLPKRAENS